MFHSLAFARGRELAIIFPPGRRRWMHAWYTCIHSSLMQASPGHTLFTACMFTATTACDIMGQGRATPPDPAQRQSWGCTQGALVGVRAVSSTTQPQTPSSAHSLLLQMDPLGARRGAEHKPQFGPCVSDSYLYTTWVFIRCHQIRFGEKRAQELFICKSVAITTC